MASSVPFYELPEKLEEMLVEDMDYIEKRKKVIDLLERTEINQVDYAPFRYVDGKKLYTRNLVMECDLFTIICLVWNPDKESPIHDHPCDGCWVRVLEGNVQETVFDSTSSGVLEQVSDSTYKEG